MHIECQLFRLVIQVFHGTGTLPVHMRIATVTVFLDEVEDGAACGPASILFDREFNKGKIAFHTEPLPTQRTLCVSNDRAGHEQQNHCVSVKVSHWNAPD